MIRRVMGAMPPPEIIGEFFQKDAYAYSRMSGGSVNLTFSVCPVDGDQTILQQIGPMIDPRTTEDYAVVADHLVNKGWEMAMPIASRLGSLTVQDQAGSHWRAMTYIQSDGKQPPLDLATSIALGRFLGKLDQDLSDLDFVPRYSIPGLRDHAGYTAHLEEVKPMMPIEDAEFATHITAALAAEEPVSGKEQPIHNDPKLDNILFIQKNPSIIIDWDNLMSGLPLHNLGDMLRSITGILREEYPSFRPVLLLPAIEAYRKQAAPDESISDFYEQAIGATRIITLELATRYMIDSVRDDYFLWDSNKFPDARAHNLFRATRQWKNYLALR